MEKFDGALASLPEHMQMVLDLHQGAGEPGHPSSLPRPPGRRGWDAAPRGGAPSPPAPQLPLSRGVQSLPDPPTTLPPPQSSAVSK